MPWPSILLHSGASSCLARDHLVRLFHEAWLWWWGGEAQSSKTAQINLGLRYQEYILTICSQRNMKENWNIKCHMNRKIIDCFKTHKISPFWEIKLRVTKGDQVQIELMKTDTRETALNLKVRGWLIPIMSIYVHVLWISFGDITKRMPCLPPGLHVI